MPVLMPSGIAGAGRGYNLVLDRMVPENQCRATQRHAGQDAQILREHTLFMKSICTYEGCLRQVLTVIFQQVI